MDEKRKVAIVDRELCRKGFFRRERVRLRHSLHRGHLCRAWSRHGNGPASTGGAFGNGTAVGDQR
jgi:hypothetical protein